MSSKSTYSIIVLYIFVLHALDMNKLYWKFAKFVIVLSHWTQKNMSTRLVIISICVHEVVIFLYFPAEKYTLYCVFVLPVLEAITTHSVLLY